MFPNISIAHIVVTIIILSGIFSWLIVKGGNKYDNNENQQHNDL